MRQAAIAQHVREVPRSPNACSPPPPDLSVRPLRNKGLKSREADFGIVPACRRKPCIPRRKQACIDQADRQAIGLREGKCKAVRAAALAGSAYPINSRNADPNVRRPPHVRKTTRIQEVESSGGSRSPGRLTKLADIGALVSAGTMAGVC